MNDTTKIDTIRSHDSEYGYDSGDFVSRMALLMMMLISTWGCKKTESLCNENIDPATAAPVEIDLQNGGVNNGGK